MNWDAIGALGEVLGAIVVFGTLIFLQFQLRQNTRALDEGTARARFDQGADWLYRVAENPEMARLYLAGLNDELRTRDERLRFNLLMQALFNQWSLSFHFPAESILGVSEADVAYVLSTRGGRAYWERERTQALRFPSDFLEFLGAVAEKAGTPG